MKLQNGYPVRAYDNVESEKEGESKKYVVNYYCDRVEPLRGLYFDDYAKDAFAALSKKVGCVLIVGDRGVGKTALVRHMQYMSDEGLCSAKFYDFDFCEISLLRLAGGIKSIAEYEERLCGVFGEMLKDGKKVAYIDNLYQFVTDNNINAMTSLYIEEYIKKGLKFVCCCNSDDLKGVEGKYFLLRHFNQIIVKEPSLDETKNILLSKSDAMYDMYGVKITEDVSEKVVSLSDKYIKGGMCRMPAKAVNALEYVAACHINEFFGMDQKTEKKLLEIKKCETEVDAELCKSEPNYAMCADLLDKIDYNKNSIRLCKNRVVEPCIPDELVYMAISSLANVPIAKLTEGDMEKLKNMSSEISKYVIGQDETVEKICKTIKRNRIGIRKKNHTMGNFLFVGTTGVGKTMLAKELTRYMFGNYDSMIRFDMSEYIDEISVNKLIGAPPGYVGYSEGGALCNAIRKNPYSVVLFDEIEKAHPSVFNALLQLLDEGHITDSMGNRISAMNCIVVMTSNIGVKEAKNFANSVGFVASVEKENEKKEQNQKSIIDASIKNKFSPEFINRLDGICHFNDLGVDVIGKIFDKEIEEVSAELKKIGYKILVKKAAKEYVVQKSEKEKMGARPLIRIIQQEIVDEITDRIIGGTIGEKIVVNYDRKNEGLTVK